MLTDGTNFGINIRKSSKSDDHDYRPTQRRVADAAPCRRARAREDGDRAIASAGGGSVLMEVLRQAQLTPSGGSESTVEQREILAYVAPALARIVIKASGGETEGVRGSLNF